MSGTGLNRQNAAITSQVVCHQVQHSQHVRLPVRPLPILQHHVTCNQVVQEQARSVQCGNADCIGPASAAGTPTAPWPRSIFCHSCSLTAVHNTTTELPQSSQLQSVFQLLCFVSSNPGSRATTQASAQRPTLFYYAGHLYGKD